MYQLLQNVSAHKEFYVPLVSATKYFFLPNQHPKPKPSLDCMHQLLYHKPYTHQLAHTIIHLI